MTTLPRRRAPTHPGEMLAKEFLEPLGITQTELAKRIHVSYPRVNEIVNGKRGGDTRYGTSPSETVRHDCRILAEWSTELGPLAGDAFPAREGYPAHQVCRRLASRSLRVAGELRELPVDQHDEIGVGVDAHGIDLRHGAPHLHAEQKYSVTDVSQT